MKIILEFALNFLLWFFYYQTTFNYSKEIDYHMFVVSSVLFCITFIFSGISSLYEREKQVKDDVELIYIHIIAVVYLIFVISFTSCLMLEFVLTNRTEDDISIWLPLHYRFKISIENYASALSLFPLSNLLITLVLDIIRVIRDGIDYFINERKR